MLTLSGKLTEPSRRGSRDSRRPVLPSAPCAMLVTGEHSRGELEGCPVAFERVGRQCAVSLSGQISSVEKQRTE